jgi:hypothetical protein
LQQKFRCRIFSLSFFSIVSGQVEMISGVQGRREGGGQIAPGPQVPRAPRNFLLGPSNYLGEIFPRKGQDIFVFLGKVLKFGTKN